MTDNTKSIDETRPEAGSPQVAKHLKENPTFLMCPPDYYGIEYEINPWMNRQRQADRTLARQQWEQLRATLIEQVGACLQAVDAVSGLPDMTFTANAGLVHGCRVILSNFRYTERRFEATHFRRWFEAHGYQVELMPTEYAFEGEGDALFVGDQLFAGYRFRTDVHTHRLIGELLGCQVLSLQLVDAYFYHLDTCFCPLAPDMAAYYPPAFDAYAQRVLANNIPRLLEISDRDAHRFGANAVVVGKHLVVNAGCDSFQQSLEAEGFHVYPVELSQFLLAGGSAKCLVLRL
jgi:N-dimethylarginine dimethylaminohydrolase